MIFEYTKAERVERAVIEEPRNKLKARIRELRPLAKHSTPSSELTPEDIENRERYLLAQGELSEYDMNVTEPFENRAWLRAFNEIATDPEAVYQNAIEQLPELIENELEMIDAAYPTPELAKVVIWGISRELYLHRRYLQETAPELLDDLDDAIQAETENNRVYPENFTQALNLPNAYMAARFPTVGTLLSPELMKFNSHDSQERIKTIDKISDLAFSEKLPPVMQGIRMEGRNQKNEITAAAALFKVEFDELGEEVRTTIKLGKYDQIVHNAILSLWLAGNQAMSYLQIHRQMTGNKETKITDAAWKRLDDAITRLLVARVEIDASGEQKSYPGLEYLRYESAVIPGGRYAFKLNGQATEGIIIDREPPLFSYANGKNQITRTDMKYLQTPGINKTPEIMIIQDYLENRINYMKRDKNPGSRTIRYQTIYDLFNVDGQDPRNKKKTATIRDHTARILDDFVTTGWISGHTAKTPTRKGRTIYSVEIKI